LTWANE